ncbi:hypothetical protein WICMUC_004721 [Wickerhamomyces mucosus]|uniref:WH1 domain-containing protein n=1 Tax=Wickerhamomyces mucosus TaxID=1378264 RepID=A0A9P8PH86_9ASCO|nr:hypothetical protein WICMUC_004721 [Wickerhamomyces mucosus]
MALDSVNKEKVKRVIPKASNKVIDAAVARLYIAYPDPNSWTYTGLSGAVILADDLVGHTFFLKLVDINGHKGVLWDQELYIDFKYNQDRSFFHSFETEDCLMGLLFDDTNDASHFFKRVSTREKHGSKKTVQNKAAIALKKKPEAPKPPGPRGEHHNNTITSSEQQKIRKTTNVLYYDDSPPPEWRSLYAELSNAGITEDMIADNKEFIKDYINQQGGPLVGLEPPIPRKYQRKLSQKDSFAEPLNHHHTVKKKAPPPPPSGPLGSSTASRARSSTVNSIGSSQQQSISSSPNSEDELSLSAETSSNNSDQKLVHKVPPLLSTPIHNVPPPLYNNAHDQNRIPNSMDFAGTSKPIPSRTSSSNPASSALNSTRVPPPAIPPRNPEKLPFLPPRSVPQSPSDSKSFPVRGRPAPPAPPPRKSGAPPPAPPPRRSGAPPPAPPARSQPPSIPSRQPIPVSSQHQQQPIINNVIESIPPPPKISFAQKNIPSPPPLPQQQQEPPSASQQDIPPPPPLPLQVQQLQHQQPVPPPPPLPPQVQQLQHQQPVPPPPSLPQFVSQTEPPVFHSVTVPSSCIDDRDALLASIRGAGGVESLKKVDKSQLDRPSIILREQRGEISTNTTGSSPSTGAPSNGGSLADAIQAALNSRKNKVSRSDDESDGEEW